MTFRFLEFPWSVKRLLGTLKSLVWVPDLEIVNRVPSEWTDGTTASKARIFYTGRWGSPD